MKPQQSFVNGMRFVNKRIFNRVTLRFAGSTFSPISIIRHVGRRSGMHYTTPVIAVRPFGDQFIFALPYGHKVDWYRNLLAAGQGTIVWHGKEYPVEDPGPLMTKSSLSALPLALRLIVRTIGSQHFFQMKSSKVIA